MLLSTKQHNPKPKRRISKTVMENEIQTKHREKRNLKEDIKTISYQLRRYLPTFKYTTILHQINLTIHSNVKSIAKHQERKLITFRRRYHTN